MQQTMFSPAQNRLVMAGMKKCYNEYKHLNPHLSACPICSTHTLCSQCRSTEAKINFLSEGDHEYTDNDIEKLRALWHSLHTCPECRILAGPENIKVVTEDINHFWYLNPTFLDVPDQHGSIAVISYIYTHNLGCKHGIRLPEFVATYGIDADGNAICYAS